MRKLFLPFFFFLFSIVLFFACRKTEQTPEARQQIAKATDQYDRFFTVPASSSTEVKAIAEAVKKQNAKHNFLASVIKNAGYPVWDKAKLVNFDNGTISGKSSSDPATVNCCTFRLCWIQAIPRTRF